ncbi:MAG: glycosyltransferase family 2 protein [Clostridia bacterium]|nr:glycosyltransferase family 2 protein [Clostridia bacterium]
MSDNRKSTPRVCAVVVTYNRRALLLDCVACLRRQTAKADILIVDNAGTDGTGEALRPLAEQGVLQYVNTGSNLGGAGGFEFGIREAVKRGCDYVWIMDDDAMPEPTALEALLAEAGKLDRFGWLSGRVLWTDGSPCRMNVQRDLRMGNLADFSGARIPAGAATFVSLLVPAQVVREVGLPIGAFFIWADDLEYTRRISRIYPCYVVPASVTVHRCETNNGGNIATDVPERIGRYRYAYRNEVYVYRREGLRGAARLFVRTFVHIWRVLRRSRDRKWERIRVIVGSTLRGLSFKPEIHTIDWE